MADGPASYRQSLHDIANHAAATPTVGSIHRGAQWHIRSSSQSRRFTESWIVVCDRRPDAADAALPAQQAIDAGLRQAVMRRDTGRMSQ